MFVDMVQRVFFVQSGEDRTLQGFSSWLLILNGWLQEGAKFLLKVHSRAKGSKPSCNTLNSTYE